VDLAGEETPDPTDVFTTFAFMNWTFAAGVWSNVSHSRLRRDLLSGLKDALIMRLARNLAEGTSAQAAKCIFLTEEFNDYVTGYKVRMLTLGHADSNTATLFALEWIQVKDGLDDSVMNRAALKLIPDEGLVHRSRQKIHPSLAAHATAPPFRGCQGIARVNLLNASVH
jgi:hypothetical protein